MNRRRNELDLGSGPEIVGSLLPIELLAYRLARKASEPKSTHTHLRLDRGFNPLLRRKGRRRKMPVRVVESSTPSQVSGANSGNTLPQACSLLTVGQTFSGTQNVSSLQNEKDEAWRVNVCIQGCDLDHGYLCGTMEALNVPMADTPSRVEADGGKTLDLSNYQYIFMRWKEQYFVNVGEDCGLTIAGFYYVCFSCIDGSISGFYYDPKSSPFQKLELKATNGERSGYSFSTYEFQ
ncbi:hypothetical protein ACJRO7_007258 [Eucalyptus globulus]|uniref:Vacuolar import/degradation protein Vid24 n=1 Tax=Eucalyptus globulus TaxID=34317 RepID=A0ABD3IKM8_EUCGL